MTEKRKMKPWEELSLADNFIFEKVMMDRELCKRVLSEILDREVVDIEYPAYEKSIAMKRDSKSIRLDVYIKDEDSVYNLEIQNYETDDLPKRSRYYNSLIDLELLEQGQYYTELNQCYVIFICTFDLFGKGAYRYVFENICEQEDVKLKDGTKKIFLNSKGTRGEASQDLKTFLKSVNGEFNSTEFSAKIKTAVERVMSNEDWKVEYMYQFIHDEDVRREERKIADERVKKTIVQERKMADDRIKEERKQVIGKLLAKMTPQEIIELGYDKELVMQVADNNQNKI